MKRLFALLLLCGCNPSRDTEDTYVANRLELTLKERQDLAAHLEERKAEQAELAKKRAAFSPVTTADLLALAGPDAKLEPVRAEAFMSLVSIEGTGAKAEPDASGGEPERPRNTGTREDAFRFARAAIARSRLVNLTELGVHGGTWLVTLSLTTPPVSKPVDGRRPASADTSWCYSECRERKKRIGDLNDQIAALDATLGGLETLNRDRKELQDLLAVDAKFMGDEVTTVLDKLEHATWLPAELEVLFLPNLLSIEGPESLVPACKELFPTCHFDPAHRWLEATP